MKYCAGVSSHAGGASNQGSPAGAAKEDEAPFWASRQQAAGRQQTDSPAGRQAGIRSCQGPYNFCDGDDSLCHDNMHK